MNQNNYNSDFATYYDLMYSWKDYAAEAQKIIQLIGQYQPHLADIRLLEVACGTGLYLQYFAPVFASVAGLDQSSAMLQIAQKKLPDLPLFEADMRQFELGQTFDVLVCLFGSIAYMPDEEALTQAIQCFARHTQPSGIVIVEAFVAPDKYRENEPHALQISQPDIKLSRHNTSTRRGDKAIFDMHTLVSTAQETIYFREYHELMLFDFETFARAFQKAGLQPVTATSLARDRALIVGIRP